MYLYYGSDCCFQIVSLWFWCIKNLDRMSTTGDIHQWGIVKIALKLASIQCGAHNNQLEVRSVGDNSFKDTHQDVSSQSPFVSLVKQNYLKIKKI